MIEALVTLAVLLALVALRVAALRRGGGRMACSGKGDADAVRDEILRRKDKLAASLAPGAPPDEDTSASR